MWKSLVALVIALILIMWFRIVHQDDEILALIHSEVVSDANGQRSWKGRFINTHEKPLRSVAVVVAFLDQQQRVVGKTNAEALELPFGGRLDLQATLPDTAVKLRVYSVKWHMGRKTVEFGPFREPWEFGYLMVDPKTAGL